MRVIPLTKGQVGFVDDEDYELVTMSKWCVDERPSGKTYVSGSRGPNGSRIRLHRFLMNPPAGYMVDHIDGNGLNNCRSNLRICSSSENNHNRRASKGTSKFKGVSWSVLKNKWKIQIGFEGKRKHIAYADDEITAAQVYNFAAYSYHGQFARYNT